jgi:hypothetical protein
MLRRTGLLFMIYLLSAGCSRDIHIYRAYILNESGPNVQLSAEIIREDAAFVRRHEIYAGFVLLECSNLEDRFPFDATINGVRSPDYELPESAHVLFTGVVPRRIFDEFRSPCLTLEGGSYLGWSITARPARITPPAIPVTRPNG